MSDELIKSLNGRIAELENSRATLQAKLKGEQKEHNRLRTELEKSAGSAANEVGALRKQVDELTKDRDGWQQKANAAPTEQAARISELETTLRTRDHRDAFKDAIGKDLADGFTVEDLWHYGQFDPAKVDKLDPQQITELVGKVKEAKPLLFVRPDAAGNAATTQGVQKTPLTVRTDVSRGARDNVASSTRYTRKEVQSPGWMNTPRGKQILEARKAGTAEQVDE
jgi:outer membrane murein-binding lipoprotein Lpp